MRKHVEEDAIAGVGGLLMLVIATGGVADDNVGFVFTQAQQNACQISQGSVAAVDPARNKGAIGVCTCPKGFEVFAATGHCMKAMGDTCPNSQQQPKK